MRKILPLFVCICFSIPLGAQTTFQMSYNYDGFDVVAGVKSISTGYVAAGWAYGSTNFLPVGIALETDTIGNVVWARRYTAGGFFVPLTINDMQKVGSGGYITTGQRNNAMLMKISSNGSTVNFAREYGSGFGNGVKEMSSGDFVVAGGSSGKTMNPNKDSTSIYVFKANSGGTYQWGRSYTLTSPTFDSHDAARDVAELPDGYAFVGYHSENNGADTTTNILLFKTDFNGTLQWMKSYGELGDNESGYSIQFLTSNELLIVGYTDKTSSTGDVALIKTDLSGNITYSTAYDVGTLGAEAGSVIKTSDGGFAVIGWVITNVFPLTMKTFLLKLNSSFGIQFARQYSSMMGGFFSKGDQAQDGGYILSSMVGSSSWDAHLIKTDASGVTGCNENSYSSSQKVYAPPVTAVSPTVHTGGSGSSFTPGNSSITPAKTTDCLFSVCTKPNSGISPASSTICQGSSATLTASGGGTYLWSTGATTSTITVNPSTTTTYTVTVTVSGCDSIPPSATVTVNSNPVPVITPQGPLTFCQGGSVVLSSSSANSYNWNTGGTSQNITASSAGNYSVSVTYANGCTNASSPVAVTVNNNPVPTITPSGATTFCQGNSVTLTASASVSYLWNNGLTSQSIIADSSGNYNVTVTDGNGCSGTAGSSIAVTVNANPAPVVSGAGSVCSNSTGTYSVANNPGNSYVWNISNGTINSGQGTNAVSVTWNSSGGAAISVTETTSSLCTGDDTLTVTINSSLNPVITASGPTSICQNDTIVLDAGGGYSTYLWNTGGNTQTISVTSAGTFSVSVTDANGCSGSSSAPVTVSVNSNPVPVISAGGSTTICEGDSVILDAGAGYSSYLWSTGETTQTIIADSSGSFSVSVTDVNGCSGTSSVATTVNVNLNPVVTISSSGSTTFCEGGNITLDAGPGYTDYLWSTGATSQTISVSSGGDYSVSVTDASGCSNDSSATTVSVFVNPLPVVSLSGDTFICTGDTAILNASGGISYVWSTGDTTATIFTSPSSSAVYFVTVNDGNCSAGSSLSLVVSQGPVFDISASSVSICVGDSSTLTASNGISYQWSTGATNPSIVIFPDGDTTVFATAFDGNCFFTDSVFVAVNSTPVTSIFSADTEICLGETASLLASGGSTFLWSTGQSTAGISVSPLTTSVFSVISFNGNCSDTAFISVTVNSLPAISISPASVSFCEGDSATICVNPTGYSFQWSSGQNLNCITVNPVVTTLFYVTATDSVSCKSTDSVSVAVVPIPDPNILGDSVTCSNEYLTLTASGGLSYLWSTGPEDTTAVNIVNPSADSTFYVTVSNGNCSASDSVFISVLQAPDGSNAGASPDTTIFFWDDATLHATGNGSYLWSPSDDLSCADCANPVASPDSTTVYYLAVTASNGCSYTDSVVVTVEYPLSEIFVPNIFSPNGDGENDFLFVYGRYIRDIEFFIYDRWGEKVFETTDKSIGWDGTYKGVQLNNAVFAYYLRVFLNDGQLIELHGNTTLMR